MQHNARIRLPATLLSGGFLVGGTNWYNQPLETGFSYPHFTNPRDGLAISPHSEG